MELDACYVTNVCKDIPLDSDGKIRKPTDEEVEAWWPILEGEIEQTAPKAILALGRTAQGALTEVDQHIPFGSVIGNVHIAYHPSFVLRGSRPNLNNEFLHQIQQWAEAVREDR